MCTVVDSGIGAGIDSYYEYLLKAYILLGDDTYLDRYRIYALYVLAYTFVKVDNELIDYDELFLMYEITDVVFGLYFALY